MSLLFCYFSYTNSWHVPGERLWDFITSCRTNWYYRQDGLELGLAGRHAHFSRELHNIDTAASSHSVHDITYIFKNVLNQKSCPYLNELLLMDHLYFYNLQML